MVSLTCGDAEIFFFKARKDFSCVRELFVIISYSRLPLDSRVRSTTRPLIAKLMFAHRFPLSASRLLQRDLFVAIRLSIVFALLFAVTCLEVRAQDQSQIVLASRPDSTRALAIDYATRRSEPFHFTARTKARRTLRRLTSSDGTTRIVLFAMNVRRFSDEKASAFTADAEDGNRKLHRLTIESVTPSAGRAWLTEFVVRVPPELRDAGDCLLRINFRGVASNRVRVGFGRIGGGLPDDATAQPTPLPTNAASLQPPVETDYSQPQVIADTIRFLEQTSFGATKSSIERASQTGFTTLLDEQFNLPFSDYPNLTPYPSNSAVGCPNGTAPANCYRDNYTTYPLQNRFFLNAHNGLDQLRQRTAFALTQIFVISGNDIEQPSSILPFTRILHARAFGNFRDLMKDVTLNPAMGRYLDMVNNNKPDTVRGIEPNENYARELLQLFTIGLYELNPDGTYKLDAVGKPIPSYDQDTVEGFANVFTGWTYAPVDGSNPTRFITTQNYQAPMKFVAASHSLFAKKLLSGVVIPASTVSSPAEELEIALDNIFNHPNVAPFISRQLIQKLVTSNPTPAYIARVAAAFNDNGAGVRGDLRHVITAILLDREARGANKTAPDYGRLREPAQFVAGFLRLFEATNDGIGANSQSASMGQRVFNSPSVFNFYAPNYRLPGSELYAPEFAIQSSNTTLNRANFINTMCYSRINPSTDAGATGTSINFSSWESLAANPAQLVAELDRLMLHNTMPVRMRDLIIQHLNVIPATQLQNRVKAAVYLVASSPQYAIQR